MPTPPIAPSRTVTSCCWTSAGCFTATASISTRTVALGGVTAAQRRLYRAVHAAQRAALEAIRGGVAADAVDAAARASLGAEGLADAFGHSTGHGLGLEVHEEPRLAKRRDGGPEPDTLEPGMVCTVEPGRLPSRVRRRQDRR